MMKYFLLSCSLIICLASVALCFENGCYGEGLPISVDGNKAADSAEDFAMDIFYRLYGVVQGGSPRRLKSFVMSPFSVWAVLTLAYLGSAGRTATELETTLRVASKADAFYGSTLLKGNLKRYNGTTFTSLDKGYFDPSLGVSPCPKVHQFEEIDFSRPGLAANTINKEVSDATFGQIKKLLQPSDLAASLFVLLNAIYFKGTWLNQFDEKLTTRRAFRDSTGKIMQTPMMSTVAPVRYADIEALGAQVVELPYENSPISMIVILPHSIAGAEDQFDLVFRRVPFRDDNHDAINVILNQLAVKSVNVVLPKFKLEHKTTELIDILKGMGAREMFDSRADFSLLSDVKPLFVGSALQVAKIDVNEEGTVASAATALIGTRSGAQRHINFVADRPFIFLLRDMKQKITIFSGIYASPADHSQ